MLGALLYAFKNMFRKPVTIQYPDEAPKLPSRYRGEHVFYDKKCIGCSLCAKVCPNNTIIMIEKPGATNPRTKMRPVVDLNRCIFCGYCAEVCPPKCLIMGNEYDVAGKTKEEMVLTHEILAERKNPSVPYEGGAPDVY